MSKRSQSAHARCEECGKIYAVPDPTHAYSCKACGGTVRASADADASRPTSQTGDPVTDARHQAATALRLGHQWIGGVAWLYRLGAIAYGCVTLVAVFALKELQVPLGDGILVVGLTTLLTLLMLIGAMRVHFEPFGWTVVIACLATAVAVVHFFGPDPLGLTFIWTVMWAALLWGAFVPTRRFRQLMARHQDLYILFHASRQTRRALDGRSPEERHARLVQAMREAGLRSWKLTAVAGGSILLASAVGSYSVVTVMRPYPLAQAREGFEQAWNAADLEAIGEYLAPAIREQKVAWLEGTTAGHGWTDAPPQVRDGRQREEGRHVWIEYELDGLTLSTRWDLRELSWSMSRFELPAPPLDPVLDRFLEAWRTSEPKAIAAFYSAESQAYVEETIEKSTQRLGWQRFPPVIETTSTTDEQGQVAVKLVLEQGHIATRWYFRDDGHWGLNDLAFRVE